MERIRQHEQAADPDAGYLIAVFCLACTSGKSISGVGFNVLAGAAGAAAAAAVSSAGGAKVLPARIFLRCALPFGACFMNFLCKSRASG